MVTKEAPSNASFRGRVAPGRSNRGKPPGFAGMAGLGTAFHRRASLDYRRIKGEHKQALCPARSLRMARRTFKYHLYPNRRQREKLQATLEVCRELYNAALQERREAWSSQRKGIYYAEQAKQLPGIKAVREDVRAFHSQVLQDALPAGSTRPSGPFFPLPAWTSTGVSSLSFREPLRLLHLSASRIQAEWPPVTFEDWRHQDQVAPCDPRPDQNSQPQT